MNSKGAWYGVVPGSPSANSLRAIDWGAGNLVAYGCQTYVVVVDTLAMTRVQTLDQHPEAVLFVKWKPDNLERKVHLGNVQSKNPVVPLVLASGDALGHIYIWDVIQASLISSFSEEKGKTASSLEDLVWHPTKPNIIISVHKKTQLTMWDIEKKSKIWQSNFKDPISRFQFNPFDHQHTSFVSDQSIYSIKDFNEIAQPNHLELEYKITDNDFQEIIFCPHSRNLMFLLFKKKIQLFDFTAHQVISTTSLEKSKTILKQLIPCKFNSYTIFCLQDDGNLSVWHRKRSNYEYVSHFTLDLTISPNTRRIPNFRPDPISITSITNAPHPNNEYNLATLRSDGSLYFITYSESRTDTSNAIPSSPVSPGSRTRRMSTSLGSKSDVLGKPGKLIISGHLKALNCGILSFSCSQLEGFQHLVALGYQNGIISIVDVKNNIILKEFSSDENLPVHGLKWLDKNRLIYYGVLDYDKGKYKNLLSVLDITTGNTTSIRKKNDPETTHIRALYPSYQGKYAIILLKEHPLQIWDIENGNHLKSIRTLLYVTSVSWIPTTSTTKESFVYVMRDGTASICHIENNVINSLVLEMQFSAGIQAVAWKEPYFVSGDHSGNINVVNLERKKSNVISLSDKFKVQKIMFYPKINPPKPPPFPPKRKNEDPDHPGALPEDRNPKEKLSHDKILVHFTNGCFAIWDLENLHKVSSSAYLEQRNIVANFVDWLSPNLIALVCSDGALRVVDYKTLSTSNCHIRVQREGNVLGRRWNIFSPLLMEKGIIRAKVILEHYLMDMWTEGFETEWKNGNESIEDFTDPRLLESLKRNARKYPPNEGNSIRIAEQMFQISNYLGSDFEIQFWSLALAFFQRCKSKELEVDNLPDYFDLLLSSKRIKMLLSEKLSFKGENGMSLAHKNSQYQLLLGNKEEAIDLLLDSSNPISPASLKRTDTPKTKPEFPPTPSLQTTDALMACLIAATINPEYFKNITKLVASNLIVNDGLDLGIQLLCLIGRGAEACKFLQIHEKWVDAAWLAKIALPTEECETVLLRWAKHLIDSKDQLQIEKAILILLSLGKVESIFSLMDKDFLYLGTLTHFVRACQCAGLLDNSDSVEKQISQSDVISIYSQYSQLLRKLQCPNLTDYYQLLSQNQINNSK